MRRDSGRCWPCSRWMSDSLCLMPPTAGGPAAWLRAPGRGTWEGDTITMPLGRRGGGGGWGGGVCLLGLLSPSSANLPRRVPPRIPELSIASPPPPPTGSGPGAAPLGERRGRAGTQGATPPPRHLRRSDAGETTTRP